MFDVQFTTDMARLQAELDDVGREELPFALALAATRTAHKVKHGLVNVMRQRFDRPTRFTLNSLYVRNARKADNPPQARVFFRDFAPKGTPAGTYLQPQVHSGQRNKKRFERALIHVGAMRSDEWAMPGAGAKQDQYGNMSRGQIVQVLSGLRAMRETGYQANATSSARSRRKGNARKYFAGEVDGERGVWQRVNSAFGEGVRPIMIFTTDEPRYRTRLPMFQIAENIVAANYDRIFQQALADAIASSKRRRS